MSSSMKKVCATGAGSASPSGLDDDAIKRFGLCFVATAQLTNDAHQIAANGAADAAVVHLDDLFGSAVDDQILFAELVLDNGDTRQTPIPPI